MNDELYHFGVKGMKWGVRRAQTGQKILSSVKKYNQRRNAIKGFSQDAYDSNKSVIGKAYDKLTGAHKIAGEITYNRASSSQRKARAEKYVADQLAKKMAKQERVNEIKKMQKEINAGASFVSKAYNKLTGADKMQAEMLYNLRKYK